MLSALGLLAAVILYFVAQKFRVIEIRVLTVAKLCLPGANSGDVFIVPSCGKHKIRILQRLTNLLAEAENAMANALISTVSSLR